MVNAGVTIRLFYSFSLFLSLSGHSTSLPKALRALITTAVKPAQTETSATGTVIARIFLTFILIATVSLVRVLKLIISR